MKLTLDDARQMILSALGKTTYREVPEVAQTIAADVIDDFLRAYEKKLERPRPPTTEEVLTRVNECLANTQTIARNNGVEMAWEIRVEHIAPSDPASGAEVTFQWRPSPNDPWEALYL